ncbi:transmembrane protein 70 homolog, mitochondrial [Culicoides brevitarsis]|uniref:transmembrane protein 70 homolog, mitochondrial n=1 Tax=Culicoides brevitarsis TaxID=469753 RepID=UPI00307C4BC1
MFRTFCLRQCVIATQATRCHSTKMLKSGISVTLCAPKIQNIEHFREIRRCFGTSNTIFCKKAEETDSYKVYDGVLAKQIKAVKIFSLASSVTGLVMQPILYKQSKIIGGLAVQIGVMGVVGFFTFVTPFLLHFVCKKYVISMDFNHKTNEYSALTYSLLMQKRITKFKVEDVVVPEIPGMFTSIVVKGTPLFLDPHGFENTDHYVKIMGYDKPIDFKLSLQEDEKPEEKSKK